MEHTQRTRAVPGAGALRETKHREPNRRCRFRPNDDPSLGREGAKSSYTADKYKTEMCQSVYRDRMCKSDCPYAHSQLELRPRGLPNSLFKTANCRNGNKCDMLRCYRRHPRDVIIKDMATNTLQVAVLGPRGRPELLSVYQLPHDDERDKDGLLPKSKPKKEHAKSARAAAAAPRPSHNQRIGTAAPALPAHLPVESPSNATNTHTGIYGVGQTPIPSPVMRGEPSAGPTGPVMSLSPVTSPVTNTPWPTLGHAPNPVMHAPQPMAAYNHVQVRPGALAPPMTQHVAYGYPMTHASPAAYSPTYPQTAQHMRTIASVPMQYYPPFNAQYDYWASTQVQSPINNYSDAANDISAAGAGAGAGGDATERTHHYGYYGYPTEQNGASQQ